MKRLRIGKDWIGKGEKTYFIADISANHDGKFDRAKELILKAKKSGADAVKFQNFRAPNIVSQYGFESLGHQLSHQAKWKKSVYQVYRKASLPWDWTEELKKFCDEINITYFSTPYDFEAVDMLDPFVPAFKIGSGDITWVEMMQKIAKKGKPVILATGASDISDVQRAVKAIRAINPKLILMQCNTNYTGSLENFKHLHLNVLRTYQVMFPEVILGLSDHTPGYTAVLGAIALGACVVEKHFTDDTSHEGPDHPFSMTPDSWKEMVERIRELEYALGKPSKFVAENERETVIVQRRCLRASQTIPAGTVITQKLMDVLRPAPKDAIFPYDIDRVLGKRVRVDVPAGEYLKFTMLEEVEEE